MRKHQELPSSKIVLPAVAIAFALACAVVSVGQVNRNAPRDFDRSRALPTDESRAEVAAHELVSLSADTILDLLRKEPGLLLQVKKALLRKAYEQGRLLDAKDLEDDALFRLIQDDQNVRVLITREIEDRYYIRAKLRREELEQGLILESRSAQAKESSPAVNLNKPRIRKTSSG